jgi:cyclohexanecarboxylate-CoA ligase
MSDAIRAPNEAILRYEAGGFWHRHGLVDELRGWTAASPDRELVVDRWGRHTYGAICAAVDTIAAGLTDLDVEPGERVAVQLPNWHQWIVLSLALEQIGAVIAPIPIMYRAKEVTDVLRVSGARTLVSVSSFRGFDYLAMIASIRGAVPTLERIVTVGEPSSDVAQHHRYETLLTTPPLSEARRRAVDAHALREVVFTSGSTGEPKGVMHTTNTIACDYLVIARGGGLTQEDVIFMPSPIGHQLGFADGASMPVHLGARAVYIDHWDPVAAVELMARERVSFACTTPTFLVDVLRSPNLAAHDGLPNMRVWMLAGAVVADAVHAEAKSKMPHTRLAHVFGMTEVGAVILNPSGSSPSKVMATGCAPAGVELRVVDEELRDVVPEHDGELVIRSPSMFLGYYARPQITAESFTPDGFFRSGDQVRIDREGYLHVTGRIKDLIKRGGESISPAEIEELLLKMPSVADAAIVGMPDVRLGERVCACVVLRASTTLSLEDVTRAMSEAGLAKYKWPERLEIVERFPRTSIGKVHKGELKQALNTKG